jgi:transcriptional regulator with XRE-family HTH domain
LIPCRLNAGTSVLGRPPDAADRVAFLPRPRTFVIQAIHPSIRRAEKSGVNRPSIDTCYNAAMESDGSSDDVAGLLARTVLTSRRRLRWTQRELSRRSGVPQTQISRIERLRLSDLRLGTVDRLLATMGVRYRVSIDAPWLDQRRQDDFVHARCSGYARRRLTTAGWLMAWEVEVGDGRSRGWIDLLAFDPASGWLLVIEIKTEIHDVGRIERTMNWYRREALAAARTLGWRPRRVGTALLVLLSSANEQTIGANRELLASAFPQRAQDLQSIVAGRAEPWTEGISCLAMIDPRSHRANWVRSSRLDGRRSPEPYRDYVDAVRVLESRGTRVRRG